MRGQDHEGIPGGLPRTARVPSLWGQMRVLVACEFSGTVTSAFLDCGHDAWACDLIPCELPVPYYCGDVRDLLYDGDWDTMLAFPPCTYLAVSGARWWKDRQEEQHKALEFIQTLMDAPIPRIAIENPIGKISTAIRKPDQIIQPWMFGHGETKATCLWLKGLPLLKPTKVVDGREARVHRMSPGPNRSKDRSRTYVGIASAMAEQWGK